MGLEDIVLLLVFLYLFVILMVAGLFKVLGYSMIQSLILGFIFVTFGIWNPVGWMLVVAFGFIQYKRHKLLMQARTAAMLQHDPQLLLSRGRT